MARNSFRCGSIGCGGSRPIKTTTSVNQGGAQGHPRPEKGAKGVRATSGAPNPARVSGINTGSKQQSCKSRGGE
jgi:hypothetical protein